MIDKLVIVESPSKAKTIEKYLGKDYKVIASKGHIIDLPEKKLGVDVESNFEVEYVKMKGKNEVVSEIKKEAKGKKKVYIATDHDREGEAIAYHIKNVLDIDDNEKCRISFNEITKKAILESINKPKTVDINLFNAQQTRRVLDRLVGYKISPLLWKKVRKGLSAGRVQSATLKIIMDREKEIEKFIPEEYWNIKANLKKDNNKFIADFYGMDKKLKLKNKEETDEVIKNIKDKDFEVLKIKKTNQKSIPPAPFTTSTLGQESLRKLGYSMKKTMSIAQKLYEAGHITYMRTDSVRVSTDATKMAKEYILDKYSEKYYNERMYKTKDTAQDAHEAIRPTSMNLDYTKLTPEQSKLYKLILNRFLASNMKDAIYDVTKITFKVDKYTFTAEGKIIKFDGYMALYIEGKDEDTKDEVTDILPELNEGEIVKCTKLDSIQKFTKPPARYTEATLIKTLEEKGIGRPSTYAPTISTIEDRLYIEKENRYLVPTEIGKVVNNVMENNFKDIVDDKFTANMETTLDKIASGKETYLKTLINFYTPFIENLENVTNTLEKVKIKDEESTEICEKCGKTMVIKTGRFGKFLACPGFPECKNMKPLINKCDVKCPKCSGDILIKKTKTKRTFYVCENNNKEDSKCDYISWSKPKK